MAPSKMTILSLRRFRSAAIRDALGSKVFLPPSILTRCSGARFDAAIRAGHRSRCLKCSLPLRSFSFLADSRAGVYPVAGDFDDPACPNILHVSRKDCFGGCPFSAVACGGSGRSGLESRCYACRNGNRSQWRGGPGGERGLAKYFHKPGARNDDRWGGLFRGCRAAGGQL